MPIMDAIEIIMILMGPEKKPVTVSSVCSITSAPLSTTLFITPETSSTTFPPKSNTLLSLFFSSSCPVRIFKI